MEEKKPNPPKSQATSPGRGRGRWHRKKQSDVPERENGAGPGPRLVQTRLRLRSADPNGGDAEKSKLYSYVPQPWRKDQTLPPSRNPREGPNYLFYSNVRPSRPSGDLVDRIHKNWWGNYNLLESHHGYIQWLFPLFEGSGMNFSSAKLGKGEAKLIRESFDAAKRVVKSYQLMLDFYGMKLVDKRTGEIARRKKYFRRYINLNQNSHNNLRITRILTSLGHLGFSRYKAKFAEFLQTEIEDNDELPSCRASLRLHWFPTLDVTSKAFIEKTGEGPEDRTESVFFTIMEKNEWEDYESEKESESEDEAIKKRKATLLAAKEKRIAKKRKKEEKEEEEEEEEKPASRSAAAKGKKAKNNKQKEKEADEEKSQEKEQDSQDTEKMVDEGEEEEEKEEEEEEKEKEAKKKGPGAANGSGGRGGGRGRGRANGRGRGRGRGKAK